MLAPLRFSRRTPRLWSRPRACLPVLLNLKFTAIGVAGILTAGLRSLSHDAPFGAGAMSLRLVPAISMSPVSRMDRSGARASREAVSTRAAPLGHAPHASGPFSPAAAVAVLCVVAAGSLLVVGFNPYVTKHALPRDTPFFSARRRQEDGHHDRETFPAELVGKGRFEKFALSSLAGPTGENAHRPRGNAAACSPLRGNVFFNVGIRYANCRLRTDDALDRPGPRPFSWLVLTVFDPRIGLVAGAIAGTVLISVLIHPECWWGPAMFPQLWFVPMIVILAAWTSSRPELRVAALIVAGDRGARWPRAAVPPHSRSRSA